MRWARDKHVRKSTDQEDCSNDSPMFNQGDIRLGRGTREQGTKKAGTCIPKGDSKKGVAKKN